MMKGEVIVIGSGLSGVMAALQATFQGKKVIVVRKGWGGSGLCSGSFDIAHTSERDGEEEKDIPFHLMRLKKENPFHPYHRSLFKDLVPAFELLKQSLPFSIRGSYQENQRFIYQTGIEKKAAFAMESHCVAMGTLLKKSVFKVEMSDLEPWQCFLPSMVAKTLEDPKELKKFANHLKAKTQLHRFSHLLVPPILGLDRFLDVRRELEGLIGMPVFEMLGIHPSVPGLRFQKGLDVALRKNGTAIVQGEVIGFDSEKKKILSIRIRDLNKDIDICGSHFVLATGKFFSGGIKKEKIFRETVFDLPLFYRNHAVNDCETKTFLEKDFLRKQPLFQIGVKTDKDLYPINEYSEVVYENVRACGTILSGFDPYREESRFGVSLLSGYQAGGG